MSEQKLYGEQLQPAYQEVHDLLERVRVLALVKWVLRELPMVGVGDRQKIIDSIGFW